MNIRMKSNKIIKTIIVVLITIIIFFPIYWMFITSLKGTNEVLLNVPSLLIKNVTIDSYIKILTKTNFILYLKNNILVSIIIVISQTMIGILAAYGLATSKIKCKNTIMAFIIGAMIIPRQITFIPLYMSFAKLGLINTYLGIIIPELISPFIIYMIYTAFLNIDTALIDIARIDGLNDVQLLLNVYIPSRISIIISSIILCFINSWNLYFWPKIISNDEEHKLLSVGIAHIKTTLSGDTISNYNEIMAAVFLSIIPIIVIYVIFQKYIVKDRGI